MGVPPPEAAPAPSRDEQRRGGSRVGASSPPRRPRTRTGEPAPARHRPAPNHASHLRGAAREVHLPSSARQSVSPQPPPRPNPRGMCGPRSRRPSQPRRPLPRPHLPHRSRPAAAPPRVPPPQRRQGRARCCAPRIQSALGGATAHARRTQQGGRGACWGLKSSGFDGRERRGLHAPNPAFEPPFRAQQPSKPIFSLAMSTGLPSALQPEELWAKWGEPAVRMGDRRDRSLGRRGTYLMLIF